MGDDLMVVRYDRRGSFFGVGFGGTVGACRDDALAHGCRLATGVMGCDDKGVS